MEHWRQEEKRVSDNKMTHMKNMGNASSQQEHKQTST
jgi:hypothetical protein